MAETLLSGYRALDLTDEKGFVCGKILAALGVDVIKIEKPLRDIAGNSLPLYNNRPLPEKSLYWFAFNTDKRSITLNLELSKGQDLFMKLVNKADFIIESFSPGYMDRLGLGYEALNRVNHRIIMTSITPFGQKGPYSHYKSCELVAAAMGGILDATGDPNRSPVSEARYSTYFVAGAAAATGTVISHYYREISGEGQQVDVSLQEALINRLLTIRLSLWEFDKRLAKRSGLKVQIAKKGPLTWLWPCKDGYIFWNLLGGWMGAPANKALSQWIDENKIENPLRQIKNWDEFDMGTITQEMIDSFDKAISTLFLGYYKKELAEEGLKRGVHIAIVKNPSEVLESPQLSARNFWIDVDHPELCAKFAYPRHFFLSSETENYIRHKAPLVGEHNNEIYGEELGLSNIDITALKDANVI
jgi:benzylsuccinate CoA-transferase BbsE subunit